MKTLALWGALLATVPNMIRVQAADGLPSENSTNTVATNKAASGALSLTNRAQLVISRVRGVDPAQIKLHVTSGRASGPFEIDITDARDCQREAAELSKELGSAAVVIFEHVSDNGVMRTNWSYRSGVERKVIAPVATAGASANARRMYVWPESQGAPSAPSGVRVRTKIND